MGRTANAKKVNEKFRGLSVTEVLTEMGLTRLSEPAPTSRARRVIKDWVKRGLFRFYRLAQTLGWNVFPVHYYTSEPKITELEQAVEAWAPASKMNGIVAGEERQLAQLRKIALPFQGEFADNRIYRAGVAGSFGPGFGFVEAQCLHAVVRHYRPAQIIEVGSGVSTLCSLVATKLNESENGEKATLTCIEPYPSLALRELAKKEPGLSVRKEPVQSSPDALFRGLKKNDILFIDSSHAVKTGSDVMHLVLEVLPLLSAGVVVHIHDIYFPYTYQRDVLKTFIHCNESALVQGFLAFNSKFEILFALSQLHYACPEEMRRVFPGYRPDPNHFGMSASEPKEKGHFPSSLWLRVK